MLYKVAVVVVVVLVIYQKGRQVLGIVWLTYNFEKNHDVELPMHNVKVMVFSWCII